MATALSEGVASDMDGVADASVDIEAEALVDGVGDAEESAFLVVEELRATTIKAKITTPAITATTTRLEEVDFFGAAAVATGVGIGAGVVEITVVALAGTSAVPGTGGITKLSMPALAARDLGADFLAVAFFVADFLTVAFLATAFFAALFFTTDFLAGAFLAGAFLATAFFAAAFFTGAFLVVAFLTVAFFAGAFLATGLFALFFATATFNSLNSSVVKPV